MQNIGNGHQREREIYTHKCATLSCKSRGRAKKLPADPLRTEFQRDVHRILYSQPFRRLRHKTQVFYKPENDHICTRLEHVLHVSSAARTVSRALRLNEDLAEAIALGHDLGHTPFGHHGEKILEELCKKYNIAPAFHHEVNSLRVVDRLAQLDREAHCGLNLTWEVRDGIVSHCGEDVRTGRLAPFKGKKILESILFRSDSKRPCTLEGCVVRLVDKVAYAGRDLEDGIQAGLIGAKDIPKSITSRLGKNNGEIVRTLVSDIIGNSPVDADYIGFTLERAELLAALIKFNYERIYLLEEVQRYKAQVRQCLTNLFEIFLETLCLTNRFRDRKAVKNLPKVQVYTVFQKFVRDIGYTSNDTDGQIVVDFISGFTDNYVLRVLDEVFVPRAVV